MATSSVSKYLASFASLVEVVADSSLSNGSDSSGGEYAEVDDDDWVDGINLPVMRMQSRIREDLAS